MKKILFPLLILSMLISVIPSYAVNNDGNVGIKVGLNLNTFDFKQNYIPIRQDGFDNKGFHIGTFYTVEGWTFRFQTGMMFIQRGCETYIMTETYNQTLNYLQVPFEVSLKLINFNRPGGLRLNVEPHIGFCLGATQESGTESIPLKIGSNASSDNISPFDLGVSLGISIDLGPVEPYIAYDLGVCDIDPDKESKVKNRSINLGMAFHF